MFYQIFEDPLLTFHQILMPEKLYYAPPIQTALFDQKTFGVQPQVGVCTISSFSNYLKIPQPPAPINPEERIEYDTITATEREHEKLELAEFGQKKLGDTDEFFAHFLMIRIVPEFIGGVVIILALYLL